MPATATIDRSEFLRQQIEDAQSELQTLESRDSEAARVKKLNDELRNFRATVKSSRAQLESFDAQIAASIEAIRSLGESSVVVNFAGLVTNDQKQLAEIEKVVGQLKSLILSRSRHHHQLAALDTRLAALERGNTALPKRFQI
jgi:wobble nucleotide-excising tRNase